MGQKYLELLMKASSTNIILFNGGKVSKEDTQEILNYHLKRLETGTHKNVAELLKIKFVAANEMHVVKSEEEKALILEIELINCELRTSIHTHSYI